MYICQSQAGEFSDVKKMMLIKWPAWCFTVISGRRRSHALQSPPPPGIRFRPTAVPVTFLCTSLPVAFYAPGFTLRIPSAALRSRLSKEVSAIRTDLPLRLKKKPLIPKIHFENHKIAYWTVLHLNDYYRRRRRTVSPTEQFRQPMFIFLLVAYRYEFGINLTVDYTSVKFVNY